MRADVQAFLLKKACGHDNHGNIWGCVDGVWRCSYRRMCLDVCPGVNLCNLDAISKGNSPVPNMLSPTPYPYTLNPEPWRSREREYP